MTTVQTRVRLISDREGFDIIVHRRGRPVALRKNSLLGPYQFARQMKGSATVAEWRSQRFEDVYRGFSCDVLKGDGKVAPGQMTLAKVRETYIE